MVCEIFTGWLSFLPCYQQWKKGSEGNWTCVCMLCGKGIRWLFIIVWSSVWLMSDIACWLVWLPKSKRCEEWLVRLLHGTLYALSASVQLVMCRIYLEGPVKNLIPAMPRDNCRGPSLTRCSCGNKVQLDESQVFICICFCETADNYLF